MAADGVPVEERRFCEGDYLRPNFIQFNRCRNVMVEGVHIRRSPCGRSIRCFAPMSSCAAWISFRTGRTMTVCDPESCRDVLVEKCLFDTGDDCIAIKSGRNDDGRRVGVASVNLIIRDCVMRDGHAGVAIGSEISGGCSNVFVENCEMSSRA